MPRFPLLTSEVHAMRTSLCAIAAVAAAACLPAQFTVLTPSGYGAAEGNSNNAYPWNRASASMRYQQIIDSSNFTGQGVTSPILIQRMRFRADATTASWAGGSWPNVVINMATSPVDFMAASATFASNLGPDLTTVYSGQVTVMPGTGNGAGVPGPYHIDIALAQPFRYDPTAGNDLTFEVILDGAGWSGTSVQADAVSGATAVPAPANGTRIYSTTSHTATTGTVGTQYVIVADFTYVPAAGLWPSFRSDVTGGASPLTVNFTDSSYSSDPAGVLAWAWDFDNDTVIDSTVQNPTHTYTACGSYSVSLTVIDAAHPPQTLTRPNLIVTDRVAASFTYLVVAPNTVVFTDTSVPTPDRWSWDLDGDNVVDSTAQNPAWFYPTGATTNVTLTAGRLCGPNDTRTQSVIPALVLQTMYLGGNGLSAAGSGNVFDLTVAAATGINVTGITMAPYSTTLTVGAPLTCEIWMTDAAGGMLGGSPVNHSVQARWRLMATGSGNFNGGTFTAPVPVAMTLNQRFYVAPGTYSMAVRLMECGVAYSNGTGANQTWANADLSIFCGLGKSPLFGTGANNPRVWNGALAYDRPDFGGLAGLGFFAAGCPNSLAQNSTQNITGLPRLGGTLSVAYDNLPNSAVINLLGLSRTVSSFGPLPFDLGPFGAPGCPARVSPDASSFAIGTGGTATWSLGLPLNAALQGQRFFLQGFVFDPTANAMGVITSDATAGVIGS